ncbi:hypothetical protein SISNIDRAFT_192035 [Sistotremastrum niveocremeum HHB9708]|uniref:Uncharacterized protein n=1 Tax=Sistotremastrum niveocremeum HHB9708 TaxID=1314777 RepID=A0A164ZE40_9AGAM|nr:hypothetical protein SISNIDRAFT_192035 [Sistotremastrum niveocremeum HHB9708]
MMLGCYLLEYPLYSILLLALSTSAKMSNIISEVILPVADRQHLMSVIGSRPDYWQRNVKEYETLSRGTVKIWKGA